MALTFSEEDVLPVIQACSRAISAIGTLDALGEERNAALEALHAHVVDVADRVGAVVPPMAKLTDSAAGARAVAGASRDQRHALRATLADVLVDATATGPADAGLDAAVDVGPAAFAPAPRGSAEGVIEAPDLLSLHAALREWAGEHFGRALENLTDGLSTLRSLIADSEGPEFAALETALGHALARLTA
ncbi:MAG TPA: hypothetical protein VG165_06560 [Solirubrobacteraceae bacterium]|jgi:hypothetical protein|nr:hypothetical protein [Solirubrobacteraceae bacterium]